jgi:phosphoribosylaminoimidazolecarboxamide formyltransferase/IMP cyclohydrolase
VRYGENPHQDAALYIPEGSAVSSASPQAEQVQGKELSYNNYNDAMPRSNWSANSRRPADVVIVKHANPCGVAQRDAAGGLSQGARLRQRLGLRRHRRQSTVPLDGPTAEAISGHLHRSRGRARCR